MERVELMMEEVALRNWTLCLPDEPDDLDQDDPRPCTTESTPKICPQPCRGQGRPKLYWPPGGSICVGQKPPCTVTKLCATSNDQVKPESEQPKPPPRFHIQTHREKTLQAVHAETVRQTEQVARERRTEAGEGAGKDHSDRAAAHLESNPASDGLDWLDKS